jgi:hypothetical protein
LSRTTAIKDVQALWPFIAAVEWNDGTSSLIDLGLKLLADPALTHIAFDAALFGTLSRSQDGTAIVWSDGSRMSAETVGEGEKRDSPRTRNR